MAQFWDQLYSGADYAYGTEPNQFLKRSLPPVCPGMSALAVADGEGRNGVWLARQGFDVLSIDFSSVGLEKARKLAERYGVSLRTANADLLSWDWPNGIFDVVVSIFIHFESQTRVRIHAAMQNALRPGGTLILTAFTPLQLTYNTGGPPQPELLYTKEQLRADFDGLEISVLEETVLHLQEGFVHTGPAAVVEMVARKMPVRLDQISRL
jgi:SAM-dependent methyltransferase